MNHLIIVYVISILSLIASGVAIYKVFKSKKISKREPKKLRAPRIPIETKLEIPKTVTVDTVKKNGWKLEVFGEANKKFDVQIEWADGSSDIVSGTVPTSFNFEFKKEHFPIKILGIPPTGDEGVHYRWELNGFHWS